MKRASAIGVGVIVAVAMGTIAGCMVARAEPPSADMTKIVDGNNAFALDLYAKLKAQEGNLFFSPYSISTALAMTYAGARGETEKQMAKVLHFELGQAELHPAFAELGKQEASFGDYELCVANALWGQKGYAFLPEFINLTKKSYSAPLQQVDFAASQQAAKTINDWVEGKTNGKITNLISPGILNGLTRLVLTDAVYFKGSWVYQFDKKMTADDPFVLGNRKVVTVPMMNLRPTTFAYARLDDLELLQMPYKGQRLSMLILLPSRNGGIGQVESQLTLARLNEWIGKLKNYKIGVRLPKFKMISEFELKDALEALGMADAFSGERADFSGMDGTRGLYVDAVLHKGFVEVNEEGTEAVAATAVLMTKGEHPYFDADRPFIFLIRDDKTGSILFMGRMMNPTE